MKCPECGHVMRSKKEDQILEIIRSKGNVPIGSLQKAVRDAGIYSTSGPVKRILQKLENEGLVLVKNFRVTYRGD